MQGKQFKTFRSTVERADETSDIWYAGYFWIDLNRRQLREILEVLRSKPFVKPSVTITGKKALMLPSGLEIWEEVNA